MSENKWQFEKGIAINGKSQITVARLWGVVVFSPKIYCKFTVECAIKN